MKQLNKTNNPIGKKNFMPFTHIGAAGRYSMKGIWVLFKQETSAKIELILFIMSSALLWLTGQSFYQWLIVCGLFCLLFAVEALNSAIEKIVDELSPDYSVFAGETKDLGSAAVFFILVILALYHLYLFAPLIANLFAMQ